MKVRVTAEATLPSQMAATDDEASACLLPMFFLV